MKHSLFLFSTEIQAYASFADQLIFIPAKAFVRDYGITGVRLSVRLSVCLSVCYHDN